MGHVRESEIQEILLQYDILGSAGCHFGHSKHSLLVSIQDWFLFEDSIMVKFDQMTPEGWGLERFPHDFVDIPGDSKLNEALTLLWDIQQPLPELYTPIWLLGVTEYQGFLGIDFQTTTDFQWLHATGARHTYGTLRILELCSGGFGGWKTATRFLGEASERVTSTVAVDHDLNAATAYAISHRANLIKSMPSRDAFVCTPPTDWVLVASVMNRKWWPAVAKWQPHIITISAPCQPWSNAAKGDGLTREGGQTLLHCICMNRFFRAPVLLLEQVLGFAQHPHKPWIIRALHMIGYKLAFDKCLDLQDQAATCRVRWIGIALRVHANLPTIPMPTWPRFEFLTVGHMEPNVEIPHEHRTLLQVTEEIKNIAADPKYFRGNRQNMTQDGLLKTRLHEAQPKVPTFMASYGSQHCFDLGYLGKFGYFGHFKADESFPYGFRFWHPAEALLLHGIMHPVFLDGVITRAWMHVGNQISFPHALLPLLYAFNLMTPSDFALYPTFVEYHDQRKKGHQLKLWPVSDGHILSEHPPTEKLVQTATQLLTAVAQSDHFHAWSPNLGLLVDPKWMEDLQPKHELTIDVEVNKEECPSVLTPCSELSITENFVPVVPIALCHEAGLFDFWISADLPWHHAEAVWHSAFKVDPKTLLQDHAKPILIRSDEFLHQDEIFYPIVISIEGSISIIANLENKTILENSALKGQDVWWDQFGKVEKEQTNQPHTLIVSEPLHITPRHSSDVNLCLLLTVASIRRQWIPSQDLYVITIEGDLVAQSLLASLVASLFSSETMARLGRKLTMHQTDRKCVLIFTPQKGCCPPMQFGHALAIAAARVCLSDVSRHCNPTVKLLRVRIKWEARPLWIGSLPADMTIDTLSQYLTSILSIATHRDLWRIISMGKKISNEVTLAELDFSTHHEAIVLHLAPALHGGGAPTTKNSQRTLHKNAIAGVLLEHGFDIQWTSKAVEQLISQFGLPKLQSVTAQPMGHQKLAAVKQLCAEAGITMPTMPKPSSGKGTEGAPWNKTKKPKTGEIKIQPNEFQILPGFFLNSDGTPSPIVTQLRGQTTGVCLLTPDQVAPWISTNQKISSDELGGFVVGKLPSETSLQHVQVVVPCLNRNNQQVLISGTLVQFGGKEIQFQKGDDSKIKSEASHLVAITLFNTDWTMDQWQEAIRSPNQFIQKALEEDSIVGAITALWGKSLRAGRAPASPGQATSMQVHVTVAEPHLHELLCRSGFNKIYCTPKTVNGRLDPQFKVIWLSGDSTQAITLAATTCHCMGMVKGRDNYGLRYAEADFSKAWQAIHPGQDEPKKSTGDKVFKIEGLPFGSTPTMIQQWLQHITWSAAPIKALGPQAWLVRSDTMPPEGLIKFNSSPVLVRLLPPRSDSTPPILVGPRPKPLQSHEPSSSTSFDPWAQWQGPRLQPAITRTIEGPVEKRLSEQDDKISALQKDLEQMAVNQKQFESQTTKSFKEAEQRDRSNLEQMQHAMKDLQKDLTENLTRSLQANSQAMQDQLKDLKSLFTSHSGKRRAEPLSDMET